MTRAFCMLANGGKSIRPHLIKAIVNRDGTIIKLKEPVPPVGYVVKPEIAKWMVEDAMVAVVNDGTGKMAKLDKWQVFGKTGTANIALEGMKGFSQDNYMASFIAGAPAENPRIVVLVSIRKPNKSLGKGYTGGAVSSLAVRNIIEKTLTYLDKQGQ
jgi:cell division protein FtsI/penicillin-binding protein 2